MSAANRVPKRACEFFRIFSRFEFALKANGFVRRNNDANWDAFANQLGSDFYRKMRIDNVAPTLLTSPPSAQDYSAGYLVWVDSFPPENVQDLFGAVRRVRNNLFHGGKSGNPDSQRDERLIAEAIDILESALGTHAEVRQSFAGNG